MATILNAGTTAATSLNITTDTTGAMKLQTSGVDAVSISSSQVVSLTNALAVTSGGTGVTTSTGSGANVLGTSPTIATPTISAPTISGDVTMSGTGYLLIPSGTTAQRPVSPAAGEIRYNTTTVAFEGYSNGAWSSIGGGASAGGSIYENLNSITANWTIVAGKNGMSVGPMTIASGVSVTVATGQRWVIL